jgi:hypothetical protein
MAQPTIAEVLHLAADKYLAKDDEEYRTVNEPEKQKYSCCSIECAVEELYGYDTPILDDILDGLEEMGLIGVSCSFKEFEIANHTIVRTTTPESQGARYAWLKFAALIAEEQGV